MSADEPTSGLDSFTASTVVESLKRLAEGHRRTTVICSIHQPRADIFKLFDFTLLLGKGGRVVFCGPTADIVPYFDSLQYSCPFDSNPADFFVDISSVDPRSLKSERESQERLDKLVTAFKGYQNFSLAADSLRDNLGSLKSILSMDSIATSSQRTTPSFCLQVYLITKRFSLNNYRSSGHLWGGVVQASFLGCFIMGLFWMLEDSLADVESRSGLLYLSVSMEYYILMIILLERYCTEIKVFDRELQDNAYSPAAYFCGHFIASFPQLFIQSFIYSLPIYYGCNLRSGPDHVLIFITVNIILNFTLSALAWVSVGINRNFAVASLIANTNFTFIAMTSGFLVNLNEMPVYISWVTNISCLSYSYRILMSNEFHDRNFYESCPYSDPLQCSQYNGNEILISQGINITDYQAVEPWIVLVGICITYYFTAGLLLHFIRFPVTGVVGDSVDSDIESIESAIPVEESALAIPVEFTISPQPKKIGKTTIVETDDGTNNEPVRITENVISENLDINLPVISPTMSSPRTRGLLINGFSKYFSRSQRESAEFETVVDSVSVTVKDINLSVNDLGGKDQWDGILSGRSHRNDIEEGNGLNSILRGGRRNQKVILRNTCAEFFSCKITAIMGSSGCG